MFHIQHHHPCLRLNDLCAYLLCVGAETGCLFLHVFECVSLQDNLQTPGPRGGEYSPSDASCLV